MTIRALVPAILALIAMAVPAMAENPAPAQYERGPVLRIPGLPPVPMPPGSRVYGPDGEQGAPMPPRRPYYGGPIDRSRPDRDAAEQADREKEKAKQEAKKAEAKKPKTREEVLADLFGRLLKAQDESEARGISLGIERLWQISGSDTVDLLKTRAQQAVAKKNYKLAAAFYDKIVVLDPDWAEGWNLRATARFNLEDDAGAIEDIAHVLALEPRHYNALTGLGFMLKRMEQKQSALRAFRKSLEINPQQTRAKKQVEELGPEVEGRGI